ncbi:MAG: hypothetical protein COB49_00330 [Alphaproteobacteria bacterium]|nr:MAG: hypothetical protein COB49_00330 [Alphaproteobacteria bacterium]
MITLRDLRNKAICQLAQLSNDTARLDVDLLLEEALGLEALDIILQPHRKIEGREAAIFQELLNRRRVREPISQILGRFVGHPKCLVGHP